MLRLILHLAAFAALGLQALPAAAAAPAGCEALAARAGAAQGLPPGLLPAIARVESSGRPWTLNEAGAGSFHETREDALEALRDALARGVESVDVGCMQINYRWHGDAFESLEQMIDPEANTEYAARFLRRLHDRLGSWEEATRHYHSADPERGERYRLKVAARIDPAAPRAPATKAAPEPPLMQAAAPERPARRTEREKTLLIAANRPLIDLSGRGALIASSPGGLLP